MVHLIVYILVKVLVNDYAAPWVQALIRVHCAAKRSWVHTAPRLNPTFISYIAVGNLGCCHVTQSHHAPYSSRHEWFSNDNSIQDSFNCSNLTTNKFNLSSVSGIINTSFNSFKLYSLSLCLWYYWPTHNEITIKLSLILCL